MKKNGARPATTLDDETLKMLNRRRLTSAAGGATVGFDEKEA